MPASGRVLAVVNQKGGVGKTTTAVNLAAYLADAGRPTLLVDLDPQANASSAYGGTGRRPHVYDALVGGAAAKEALAPTEIAHLALLPSGPDLVGAEVELVDLPSRERQLARVLEEVGDRFRHTIVDCPPSLGLLTLNALCAADEVLIPLQCEYYALEGLARLLETTDAVRRNLNPRLRLAGILLTMVDLRSNLARQVQEEVLRHFGRYVFRTAIPRNIRLSEAPSHGKPILLYDPRSRGALAYEELAGELLAREEDPEAEGPGGPAPPSGPAAAPGEGEDHGPAT